MSKALVQALQCPLLSATVSCAVAPRLHRQRAQRPVWREDGAAGPGADDRSAAFYTIRTINGVQRVVRRPAKRCSLLNLSRLQVSEAPLRFTFCCSALKRFRDGNS